VHEVGANLVGGAEHGFGVVRGSVLAAEDDVDEVGSELGLVLVSVEVVEGFEGFRQGF